MAKKPTKKPEPTIIGTKKYSIEMRYLSDGKTILNRTCDGFNAYELLGLMNMAQSEIIEQIRGKIRPTEIKRNVVTE